MAEAGNTPIITRRDMLKSTVGTGLFALVSPSIMTAAQPRRLSDEQLLDEVQQQTLKYFWDFGHPVSGMARERSNNLEAYNQDVVTTGATGFGVMALVVGQSRGWLTREETCKRISTIVSFLEKADSYHGIFPHFMDGSTGKTRPFSKKDDGADIVETSFLMMGLLTAREYFNADNPEEAKLRGKITSLYERADWKWHEREDPKTHKKQLLWHWSPNFGWDMNLPLTGWNEGLVTYMLAAGSPTHPISPETYEQCWCNGSDFNTRQNHNGIALKHGPAGGGPLFFSHYSFMGLSPEGLKDKHGDYWQQNKNHVLINHEHCARNPGGFTGYSKACWGLTASDEFNGYGVHCPVSDNGTISPTAAISSLPYTPELSMAAIRHFYEELGDKTWGKYGFYDAFNQTHNWYSNNYLGIDQGPIVVMTENYRSGLPWQTFMRSPEVKRGLKALNFESPYLTAQPAGLIRLQVQSRDAQEFLEKLCGPHGHHPLDDRQFALAVGLDGDSQWQVKQLRTGKQALNNAQKEGLLRVCGYMDAGEIRHASQLLSQMPEPDRVIK